MNEIYYRGQFYIVHTAWAETARGSGFSNPIYWVIVTKKGGPNPGELEKIALQLDEMTRELRCMFYVSEALNAEISKFAAVALREKLSKKSLD